MRDIQIETIESTSIVGTNEIRLKILFNIRQDPNTLNSVSIDFTSGDITSTDAEVGASGY